MVPSFFFPNTWPLVGGDFNCYDSVFDKFWGAPSLDSVFKGCRLGDAWRLKHSREKQLTWFNADLTIASRLDSFLIPKSSYHLIISCDIFPCTYSDHGFAILNLDFRDGSIEGRVFGNLIIRYLMMYFSALRLFN